MIVFPDAVIDVEAFAVGPHAGLDYIYDYESFCGLNHYEIRHY